MSLFSDSLSYSFYSCLHLTIVSYIALLGLLGIFCFRFLFEPCLLVPRVAKLSRILNRKGSKTNLMGSGSRRRDVEDSEYPGFYQCVDDSVVPDGKLKIPQDFCQNFEGKVPKQCILQSLSRTWQVDVKEISGEVFLEKGWKEFSIGNRLQLGELVVLQYIGEAKFSVKIYGHNHCSKMTKFHDSNWQCGRLLDDHFVNNVDSDSDSEPRNRIISLKSKIESPRESDCGQRLSKRGRVRNIATTSSSGNPCFCVEMCETHVTKGPMLTPRSFMKNMHKPEKVKLQVGNMAWDVKWIHSDQAASRFSGGWIQFVNQNGLQKGDFCNFELISKTNEVAVMKVSILKM